MKIKIKSLIISTSFLLVLFCFASAAEPISPYEIQYLEDMMQTWDTFPNNTPVDFTSLYAQFESDCNNYPYYVTNNSNYILMCKKPSFGLVSVYDSSYRPIDVAFNVSEYPNWQDSFPFIVYQSYTPASDWRVVIRFEVSAFSGGMTVSPMRFSWTGNVSSSKTDYTRITYYNSNSFSVSNTSWFGNVDSFYCCNGSKGTGYNSGWSVFELPVTPIQIPYTDDSRLKLSHVFGLGGVDTLLVNLSEFYAETGSSPASSTNFSDITLNFEFTDDQDNVTTESFVLSSSNSTIEKTSYPSIANMYLVQTPYSTFGDFSNYDSVKITGCSFSRTYSVITQPDSVENFSISCNFYLKESASQFAITPEEIELPDYEDPEVKTDSQISNLINDLNNQSSYYFDGEFSYQNNLNNIPAWADIFSHVLTRMDLDSPYFAGHWYDHNPFVFGDSQIDICESVFTSGSS